MSNAGPSDPRAWGDREWVAGHGRQPERLKTVHPLDITSGLLSPSWHRGRLPSGRDGCRQCPWGTEPVDLDELVTPPTWHADALCREHPEVNFFPKRGQDPRPAKAVCHRCSVQGECREWALAQGVLLAGVFGGLSQLDRMVLSRVRADTTPLPRQRRRENETA